MVADGPKLTQDLQEAGSIETQPNGFGYGLESIIGLVGDAVSLRVEVSRRIRDGVTSMMRLQQQFQRAQRPASEVLSRLVRVIVNPILRPGLSSTAATAYAFRYDVLSQAVVSGGGALTNSGTSATPTTTISGVIIPPVG